MKRHRRILHFDDINSSHEVMGSPVRWTDISRGSHFLDREEPELVAQDMRAFFRPLRGSHFCEGPKSAIEAAQCIGKHYAD